MLTKEMLKNKVIIGAVGVVVLVIVLTAAIKLITTEKGGEPKAEQNHQEQAEPQLENKMTDSEVARRLMEERRQERLSSRSREDSSSREGFDKWLKDIRTAYEQNDMEKMGQLLKEMQEIRERLRERRNYYIDRRRDLRDSRERERIPPYEIEKRRREQVEAPTDKP
ncbi:MAG: hypothetical protein ACYS9Y_03215 [Planctomycetota bacterium]|jgi:flagellar biosynthesis/type III secretory pathway M-ring protein FliF/YscJ